MASSLSGDDRRELDRLAAEVAWCRRHLLRLLDFAPPAARVIPPEPGPVGELVDLSGGHLPQELAHAR